MSWMDKLDMDSAFADRYLNEGPEGKRNEMNSSDGITGT